MTVFLILTNLSLWLIALHFVCLLPNLLTLPRDDLNSEAWAGFFVPPAEHGVSVGILPASSPASADAINSFSLILAASCFLFPYRVYALSGRLPALVEAEEDNHYFWCLLLAVPQTFLPYVSIFLVPAEPFTYQGGWQELAAPLP